MNIASDICVAILAAGQSKRFGKDDKLTAMLHGKMLGLHIAEKISDMGFGKAMVIASDEHHPCAAQWGQQGFEVIINPHADQGMATSIALAANIANASDNSVQMSNGNIPKGLMICLADMPFISSEHLDDLLSAFHDSDYRQTVISHDGEKSMPPAIFPHGQFAGLSQLRGDVGAKAILSTIADVIQCPMEKAQSIDIDAPDMLARMNALAPNDERMN